jgi:hypothetical protein
MFPLSIGMHIAQRRDQSTYSGVLFVAASGVIGTVGTSLFNIDIQDFVCVQRGIKKLMSNW